MKTAILHVYTESYRPLYRAIWDNHAQYADKWGYECIVHRTVGDAARAMVEKVGHARAALDAFDLVIVCDLDLIFCHQNIALHELAVRDLTLSSDAHGPNMGMCFLKNTPWTKSFVTKWVNAMAGTHFRIYPNIDQTTVVHLLFLEPADKWAVLPQRVNNSYMYELYPHGPQPQGQYRAGDFVLHLPAVSLAKRLTIFKAVESKYFTMYHWGKIGDLIACLPAMLAMAGTKPIDLVLPGDCPAPKTVGMKWTPKAVEKVAPLLLQVVGKVRYAHVHEGWNANIFRRAWDLPVTDRGTPSRNIAEFAAVQYGVDIDLSRPWLTVPPRKVARFVLNRTARYHNDDFPWAHLIPKTDAVFVGTPAEHKEFANEFGPIPYHKTDTLLDLAQVMAGAELTITNQSAVAWLAHALRVPLLLERVSHFGSDNVCIDRERAWYWQQKGDPLPEILPPPLFVCPGGFR